MTPTDLSSLLSRPFTLAVAARHGVGRSVVRRLVRDGDVRRVIHGVYVGAHVVDALEVRARAAVMVLPRGAVVCGRTAARLHGVRVPADPRERARRTAPIEVAVPVGAALPRRHGCRARVLALRAEEVVRLGGVPVTSPVRTAADLARTADRDTGVVVLDGFLRAGLIPADALAGMVGRYAGHPGRRRLAEVVRLADGRSADEDETRLRLAVLGAGLAAVEVGWEVRSAFGRTLHRFALAWPGVRVGVDLTPHQQWIRARARSLAGQGWVVLECPAIQVRDNPAATIARIASELRLRDRRRGDDERAA
ncbi:type IV toxin-antitoxin system AbiEi family antitoxin domain-containing protein [Embleya sp. NBC_00896]|uniref:type IV toxin-antitoxin system AbiEi family antitoxin domain-containing protein n=1 Tax=Embleya sp. NBC_00896 TaxID=2975961 RepID=UPI003867F808|nr:type IV toxin-antitoxin system AbiEi family antitoxin domain-containing protein [Embleya sp. NBC_00896]